MKIKKPAKPATPAAATAAGGATIADRFKLDLPAPGAAKKAASGTVSAKGASIALGAALVGLAIVGILTFVIYQHWEFLKNA